MTKKDYELIASVLRAAITDYDHLVVIDLARDFANALQADNPRFERDTFLRACGVSS